MLSSRYAKKVLVEDCKSNFHSLVSWPSDQSDVLLGLVSELLLDSDDFRLHKQ